MEKRESDSFARHFPRTGKRSAEEPNQAGRKNFDAIPPKPSRADISRCINIWARLYDDIQQEPFDRRGLCLPSRPWLGGSANGAKPLE